jgi:hypothetical protein
MNYLRIVCLTWLALLPEWAGVQAEDIAVDAAASAPLYAVVVQDATADSDGWHAVVEALVDKHHAFVVRYPRDVTASLPQLLALQPDFIAFVARPTEVDQHFVANASRLTRRLGDAPYPSCRWGIITGYDSDDAMRMVTCSQPLNISCMVDTNGPDELAGVAEGFATSDGLRNDFWNKRNGVVEQQSVNPDPTQAFAEAFNHRPVQYVLSSNRQTGGNLQFSSNMRAGWIASEQGNLYAMNTRQETYQLQSSEPKIYLAAGNDRGGLIDGPNAMALGWLHSGGVDQLAGYTSGNWYGYMGWSIEDLFRTGTMDFADAFFFSGVDLVHTLQKDYASYPAIKNHSFVSESYREQDVDAIAVFSGLLRGKGKDANYDDDLVGLLWDQDSMAFYGDPAWQASLPPGAAAWSIGFVETDHAVTCTITPLKTGTWPARPICALLPQRMSDIHVTAGMAYAPVVTSSFILVPLSGPCTAGSSVTVTFAGKHLIRPDVQKVALVSDHVTKAMNLAPPAEQPALINAILCAGANADSLLDALAAASPEARTQLDFLIENMPQHDLETLSGARLAQEVQLALQAKRKAPWGASVPEDVFQNYVLPYACLDEARDPWRAELCAQFSARAWACAATSQAVLMLNKAVFPELKVTYHPTKRPRPNQSPAESKQAHYASCSGLSILLVDACRACGIPARIVGIPDWSDGKGDSHGNHGHNHTWMEIWDAGHWHYLGASELSSLDHTWFSAKTANEGVDRSNPFHCIYAASFRRTGLFYPMVWSPGRDWVPGTDITREYSESR